MKIKLLTLCLIVVSLGLTTKAQDASSAYNFLNITSSARIYGLGGINISTVEDDISTIDQNPALLGGEMSQQVGLNYMRYIGEANFAGLKYAHSAGEHGAWAASVQYMGYGEMKEAEATGVITGTFKAQDLYVSGSYSDDITDMIRGGISLKMIYSSYDEYSAMAIVTDLGVNYYNPDTDLSLSAVIANLGGQVKKFDNRYERPPIDVRLGVSKSFNNLPVRFSMTAWNLTKWSLPYYDGGDGSAGSKPKLKDSFGSNLFRHLVFGADFVPSDRYYVSLGFNYKTRTDMNTYARNLISGFSLGAGLNVKNFAVGVALAQPHTGATTFMLNLNMNLADLLN